MELDWLTRIHLPYYPLHIHTHTGLHPLYFYGTDPQHPPTRPPKLKDECVWPRPWEAEQHIPLTSVTSLEIGTWIKPRQLGSIKAKNYMCCTRGLHLFCLRVKPNVAERRANNENREDEMSSLWHIIWSLDLAVTWSNKGPRFCLVLVCGFCFKLIWVHSVFCH